MYVVGLVLKGVEMFSVAVYQVGLCDFYYSYRYCLPDWLGLLPNFVLEV